MHIYVALCKCRKKMHSIGLTKYICVRGGCQVCTINIPVHKIRRDIAYVHVALGQHHVDPVRECAARVISNMQCMHH